MLVDIYYYMQYIFSPTTLFDTGSGSVESSWRDLSKTGLRRGKFRLWQIIFLILHAWRQAVNPALGWVRTYLSHFGELITWSNAKNFENSLECLKIMILGIN